MQNLNIKYNGIFVTGTDTEVGKTIVSAILVNGLECSYWKPVQSGIEKEKTYPTDSQAISRLCTIESKNIQPEAYKFRTPLSPHLSAAIDDQEVLLDNINLPLVTMSPLIVEGAGGVLVPLNKEHLIIDLMEKLKFPILIVARSTLGTINHTLLTIEALRTRKLEILGVVMNGPRNEDNENAIESYGDVEVLASIEDLELNKNALKKAYEDSFEEFDRKIRHSTMNSTVEMELRK